MKSEENFWPGGGGRITVEGVFPTAGGVSSCVTMFHLAQNPDGSYARRGTKVTAFRESGTHDVALSPGKYWFEMSGPERLPWSARVRFGEAPRLQSKAKGKKATLEDRVEAIEARLGNAGLNS